MMLKPVVYAAGEVIIREGEIGHEMYAVCRGQVEVLDRSGKRISVLPEGAFFGEMSLVLAQPRSATVRALTDCDLFVLEQRDVDGVLKDFPQFAASLRAIARSRS
jgi:glucose-6-phosphate 1-dehydrogenase